MTIGIGAYSPAAGLAVFRAFCTAEKVARRSIGGFATFAAITGDARTVISATQRGGASTAFVDVETKGVEPPEAFAEARIAAVISSGPDRSGDIFKGIPSIRW